MPMATVHAMPQEKLTLHLMQNAHQVRKLAPAPPDRASVLVSTQEHLRCKKKINFNHLPYTGPGPQPASVARRNARERNRVKQVNNGFATLREHIPNSIAAVATGQQGRGASKKLSKVDTLRLAVEYIRSLQQLLDDQDDASSVITDPHNYDTQSYYAGSPESTHHLINNHTPPSSEASVSPSPPAFPAETTHTKCATYENYAPMSPEDEELLDVIYWWQQQ